MWPFKNRRNLARPDEFPAAVNALRDRLKGHGSIAEADRLKEILEGEWTTSNEIYGELFVALTRIQRERHDLPPDLAAEVRRLIKSIDHICRWR